MTKLTPLKAIRIHCKECVGTSAEVKICGGDKLQDGTACVFYKYRLGKGGGKPSVKTIKAFCRQCMGGNKAMVDMCFSNVTCILHYFRLGKNPNVTLSEERLTALKENLKKIRRQNDRKKT